MNTLLLLILLILLVIFLYNYYKCNEPLIYTHTQNMDSISVLFIGGTHGNEQSGSIYLNNLINKLKTEKTIVNYNLTIIPSVNKCGLMLNCRYVPYVIPYDINRNYKPYGINKKLISNYIDYINNADIIIDIHEGWGYAKENKGSLGAGIYGYFKNKSLIDDRFINKLIKNNKILDKFVSTKNNKQTIKNSLEDYCKTNGKDYVLIETSRKDSMDVRLKQLDVIISSLINIEI